MWTIDYSDEFESWWNGLEHGEQELINERVKLLEEHGPGLGRPIVDTIAGSKIANLKELRASSLRVLFVFDPRRHAYLLLGGDKAGQWSRWYRTAIPLAEEIYERHRQEIEREEDR